MRPGIREICWRRSFLAEIVAAINTAPWECRNLILTQIPEVLIIMMPIVSPCCQILDNLPILHEGGGLSGELTGTHSNES